MFTPYWPSAVFCCWRCGWFLVGRSITGSSTSMTMNTSTRMSHIIQGPIAEKIGWAFTGGYANNWHPLTWFSHLLDYELYGLNAGGHHATNVLLHAATAILLFLVLRRMTGDLWPSAFVAAVFAIHPLRVESVAWVSERKDVLSGLFFMLTLLAYRRLCPPPILAGSIFGSSRALRPGPDGEADAGDATVRAAAVGLLAAGTICICKAATTGRGP